MAGVPLTLGFVGKDGAYEALLHGADWFPWLLVLMVLASVLLGLAGLIAGVLPFRGDAARVKEVHDPAWPLWIPPLILATGGLFVGVAPSILNGPLSTAATAVAGMSVEVSLSVWHGLTPALLLSVLTLAAVGVAYVVHEAVRARTWKPRHGTEELYDGALSALDAVSRAIAPALHSASLRTYVMVIVATSVLVGGAALVTDPGLGSALPRTSITAHDVLIVLLIIAGAIAAAFARSTMSAVLSLGAVGYGVATMFLSFGAPDLAMTQFSVETLTVLIYVLVFRHFRELGPLSPRLVRARDGLIAVGIGIFIGGLLVSVATTETPRDCGSTSPSLDRRWGTGATSSTSSWSISGRSTHSAKSRSWQPLQLAFVGCCDSPPTVAVDHEPVQPVNSPIFRTAARLLMPLLLLFSVFLLLRGHNEPGGGFVGGLVAAAAFALYAIAFGVQRARQALLVKPMTLLGAGLLIALAQRPACRPSWPTVLDRAMGSRISASRDARHVRRRRVSRRRGRGADDDLQPRGGVLRWRPCSRWRPVFYMQPGFI